jgi:hypothetical protein
LSAPNIETTDSKLVSYNRDMLKTFVAVALLVFALGFLIWWIYGNVPTRLPSLKLLVENWYWRHFGDPFDAEARHIAGRDAVSCSDFLHGSTAIVNCALTAQRQHRAFVLRYDTQGKDSSGVSGIVGASDGTTYDVAYDISAGYVTVWKRRCPEPVNISAVQDKWGWDIHCLPPVKSVGEVKVLRDDWAEHVSGGNQAK